MLFVCLTFYFYLLDSSCSTTTVEKNIEPSGDIFDNGIVSRRRIGSLSSVKKEIIEVKPEPLDSAPASTVTRGRSIRSRSVKREISEKPVATKKVSREKSVVREKNAPREKSAAAKSTTREKSVSRDIASVASKRTASTKRTRRTLNDEFGSPSKKTASISAVDNEIFSEIRSRRAMAAGKR